MKRQSFLEGALVLMAAGLITRVMGFILRIFLVKYIGDEGLGLFQMIYPFYMTLLLLSTAGFPVAISKLIPEKLAQNNKKGALRLWKTALIFVSFTGALMATLLFFSAEIIANHIFSDNRTYLILLAISPALLICPLGSTLKGFFQGLQTMVPTAVALITEQISRISATVLIVIMVSGLGLMFQAAGIALGIGIGELCSLLILIYLFPGYIRSWNPEELRAKSPEEGSSFFHDFFVIAKLALPITAGRLINSLMISGEAILIPRQLQVGGKTVAEATSLYGQLSGMAVQLVLLPTVITIALTTSLIPDISRAYTQENYGKIKRNYRDIIRISTYLGLVITVIFVLRGTDICQLIFSHPEAGNILASLAGSATFIYFLQVSSGMLNGLGKPGLAVRNLTIGSLVKLLILFYLVRQPGIGITGAAVAITAGYGISALLNYITIGNIIGFIFNFSQAVLKPLLGCGVILLINPYLDRLLAGFGFHIKTIFILLILSILYLAVLLVTGAITPADINRFKP